MGIDFLIPGSYNLHEEPEADFMISGWKVFIHRHVDGSNFCLFPIFGKVQMSNV